MNLPAKLLTIFFRNFQIIFGVICQFFFSNSVDFFALYAYNYIRIIKTNCVFVRTALRRRSIFLPKIIYFSKYIRLCN